MTFYDPTLYGREEDDEFGDTGAYTESLEEDFEEEEEEEEEPGTPEPEMSEPVAAPPPPAPKPEREQGRFVGRCEKIKIASHKMIRVSAPSAEAEEGAANPPRKRKQPRNLPRRRRRRSQLRRSRKKQRRSQLRKKRHASRPRKQRRKPRKAVAN